ncbi:hypothetical protein IUY40_02890 [Flavobacterium sp. ALJ2]|uniref:hypothetical protein n=1 Tax=Flavobacterium sp. ALJ2 TaxID=2786960 RepID=UPI00189FF4CC|nr:hypothetical protein [Flavobacterium sp. ALJ2]MBF7090492.1 hypothetical protein [Flavobacterium sp. ALJ2]
MSLPLQQQRKDLDETSRMLDAKIQEMTYQRQVLINAFNSIDKNKEDILTSGSILAQEARDIMYKLKKQ